MASNVKPSIDEIKELDGKCTEIYGNLQAKYEEDEKFYELNFKDKLNVPKQFEVDRVVTPTARDMPDTFVDNIDIQNVRVHVNKKGTSGKAKEAQEMERKFYLGLIHRTNVENQISPWRQVAKHFALHGLGVFKTIWDADNWQYMPQQNEGESDDAYAERLDEWRAETHLTLPIIIQAINPYCIMPDPYQGGQLYVIEKHKKLLFDAKRIWPHWKPSKGKNAGDEVEYISYWDSIYRCDLVDGDPVLKIRGGVVRHGYGFNPYTLIESGLGNLNRNADPAERYVGILRYMTDMLVSESTNYTMNDILIKFETMKGGYKTGPDSGTTGDIKQEYGTYWDVGVKDVEFHDWERKLPPSEAYQHLALTRDYIDSHAGPRSVRGLSEANIRSGAHERYRVAQATARYGYATPAFQNGTSKALAKCAMLVKNKIPGDFKVWAKTPNDEIDVVVKKDLLREPFAPYVEFSPISEEDEYRRQDALVKLVQAGIYTPEFAWTQMNNVDPQKMAKDVEKARLRASPMFNQMKDEYLSSKFQEALQEQGMPIQLGTQPGLGVSPAAGAEAGRRMVPPIPQRAGIGSAQEQENWLRQTRQGMSSGIQTQGRGGGGAR